MNPKAALFFQQSAVIPYRLLDGELEIMMITSSAGRRWIIPKGQVEPNLTPQDSAEKEAWEEAGLLGRVGPQAVGSYEYQKWGGICQVEVYLLQVETVLEDWPEAKKRKREWVSLSKAVKRVEEAGLKKILVDFPSQL